ncbi:heavy-metal-associated domain-containing protein [Psychroserpens mesophilus]|uniref:heavy-metal-associated domain-containing protein n=1 Tax=Psychroserpens mesophilus TaxID=325473 RepID=UPI003D650696
MSFQFLGIESIFNIQNNDMMRTKVHLQHIKCSACEHIIFNSLSEVKNISDVEVNHEECTVAFDYHTKHDFEKAKHVLSRIGYPIVGKENKLKTEM